MQPRFRSSFAAPTGFVAAVTRVKPRALATSRVAAPRVQVSAIVTSESDVQQQAA